MAIGSNTQAERGESEIRRSLKRDPVERNRAGGRPTEAEMDKILEHTFPASDPPSWTLGLEPRDAHAAKQRPPHHHTQTRNKKGKPRHEEPKHHYERC
jgi:hypothetical protein